MRPRLVRPFLVSVTASVWLFLTLGCSGSGPATSVMPALTPQPQSTATASQAIRGNVTSIVSSTIFVFQTGDPHGHVRVLYSKAMVDPNGARVSVDQMVLVKGNFNSENELVATDVKVESPSASPTPSATPSSTPSSGELFDHVSIVVMENHNYDQIIGSAQAPYINRLASANALFTNSHAISHPSEPNYLALYSGSAHGVTSDDCPLTFSGPSLGGKLIHAGESIVGYMEDLPSAGWTGCSNANYWRKHDPLIDFTDTPASHVVPFGKLSHDIDAGDYPSVAFIVPNELDDMHDGTIAEGDAWLAAHVPAIIKYDATHNGLLIITWDENAGVEPANQIPTILVGPMVQPGSYAQSINHYNVLRTITNGFSLSPLTTATGITGVWR